MAVQISRQRAGPIYKPVEMGERCLLSDKLLGECMIYLRGHRQYFPVVDLAQVKAAGESCPNPVEPLPRAVAHGGLSAVWRWVPTSAATLSHRYWLIPFTSVAPWAFLAGLVIPSGCTSLLAGQGPLQVGGEGKGRVCTMMGILFPTQVAVIKPQNAGGWKLTVFTK